MRLMRRLLVLVAIAVGVLAVFNFYSDNREVEARARRAACAGEAPSCTASLVRLERSPVRQVFWFRTRARTHEVACTRAYWLLGPVTCARR